MLLSTPPPTSNGRCLKPHIFIFVPHCLLVDSDSGSGAGNKRNTHLVSRHDAKAGGGEQQQTQKHIVGAKTVENQQCQWGIRFLLVWDPNSYFSKQDIKTRTHTSQHNYIKK